MKFVCPEVEGAFSSQDAAKIVLNYIFQHRFTEIESSFEDTVGLWKRVSRKYNSDLGYIQAFFALEKQLPILGNISLNSTPRTISQLAADLNIDIEISYIELGSFSWRVVSVYDLHRLPYWITIFKEDGLILAKPERPAGSQFKGEIPDTALIHRTSLDRSVGYQGETGFDYNIAADTSKVGPTLIDATFKDQVLNKYKSVRNAIYFMAGFDASPLDWVQGPDGGIYLIVSKKQSSDQIDFLYTAVQEYSEIHTYFSGDVKPVNHVLSDSVNTIMDEYGHSGIGVSSFEITDLDLLTDGLYEWIVDFNALTGNSGWRLYFKDQDGNDIGKTAGTDFNYQRELMRNGAGSFSQASGDNRLFANTGPYPYGFRILIYAQHNSSGDLWITFDWKDIRYTGTPTGDYYWEGRMTYQGSGVENLTGIGIIKWTGTNSVVDGFRSILLKHRI